jgi:hypothetical protein
MPDLLLDALPVIDLLEITANTRAVARLTRRDQSSVSRIYRRASNRLGLCFGKDERGEYRATANQALLQDLRRSSQRLRLQQPGELRWIGSRWLPTGPTPTDGDAAALPPPLQRRWGDERRTAELVRDHLLDLAVVTDLNMETLGASLVALPMARQPILIAAPPEHPLHGPNPVDAQALTAWPLQSLLPATSSEQRCHLRGLGLTLQDGPHHHSLQSLSLVPAMALPARPHQGRLAALPFHTGLESVEVLLLHRDLHDEATLIQLAEAVVRLHRDAFGRLETLEWLL